MDAVGKETYDKQTLCLALTPGRHPGHLLALEPRRLRPLPPVIAPVRCAARHKLFHVLPWRQAQDAPVQETISILYHV